MGLRSRFHSQDASPNYMEFEMAHDMNDLKSCPFCGGKDIEKLDFSPNCDTRPHIHCRDCGIDVYDVPTVIPIWHRNDSMVQAWNSRAERTCHAESDLSELVFSDGCRDPEVTGGWPDEPDTCEKRGKER